MRAGPSDYQRRRKEATFYGRWQIVSRTFDAKDGPPSTAKTLTEGPGPNADVVLAAAPDGKAPGA